MNIGWSPESLEDLASLRAYIAENNPAAARRVVRHIVQNIEQLLPDNANIGRAGRVGTMTIRGRVWSKGLDLKPTPDRSVTQVIFFGFVATSGKTRCVQPRA